MLNYLNGINEIFLKMRGQDTHKDRPMSLNSDQLTEVNFTVRLLCVLTFPK